MQGVRNLYRSVKLNPHFLHILIYPGYSKQYVDQNRCESTRHNSVLKFKKKIKNKWNQSLNAHLVESLQNYDTENQTESLSHRKDTEIIMKTIFKENCNDNHTEIFYFVLEGH